MTPRPVVLAFAEAMEERLAANDHKGGWRGSDPEWLMDRLYEEVRELASEVHPRSHRKPDLDKIRREAADVANYALMVADRMGALKDPTRCDCRSRYEVTPGCPVHEPAAKVEERCPRCGGTECVDPIDRESPDGACRPAPAPTPTRPTVVTLRELQRVLPWTVPYSEEFKLSRIPFKDLGHALAHVLKSVGKIAAMVEKGDHGIDSYSRAEIEPAISDLVVCALRMANVVPIPFDLTTAVVHRIEGKNNVKIADLLVEKPGEGA